MMLRVSMIPPGVANVAERLLNVREGSLSGAAGTLRATVPRKGRARPKTGVICERSQALVECD
jgi:hypothetical protein